MSELDEQRSALSMWVMSRSGTWVIVPIFGAMFLLLPAALVLTLTVAALGAFPVFAAMALMLLTIAAVMLEAHSKVTVGADGVLIRRRFRDHFVPFSDIGEVREADGVAIRLMLHSGAFVDVYTAKDEQVGKAKYVRGCEALLTRIREGVEAANARMSGDESHRRVALIDHAHSALRAQEPVQRVPYRAAPPPDPSELLRVVEGDGSPTSRAAAAVLVHRHGGREAKNRVRVASDATANPKLKKLFRVASSETEVEALEPEWTEASGVQGGRRARSVRRPTARIERALFEVEQGERSRRG